MWNIKSSIHYLLAIRSQVGPLHGSDELCMLMRSLAKREKPEVVVELGTGLRVTSAWIAAALQENGQGVRDLRLFASPQWLPSTPTAVTPTANRWPRCISRISV